MRRAGAGSGGRPRRLGLRGGFVGPAVSDPAWSRSVPAGRHRDASAPLGPPDCGTFFGVHPTVGGVPLPVFSIGGQSALRRDVHDYVARSCGW